MPTQAASSSDNNLTFPEFALEVRICPRSVAYLAAQGKVKVIRQGRKVFIPRSEAARLNRNGVASIRPRKAVKRG